MALPMKQPTADSTLGHGPKSNALGLDVAPLLQGAPRRRGSGPLYPRLLGGQVSDEMYAAVKAEVARRAAAGEPSDVASIGAIIREAVADYLNIPI